MKIIALAALAVAALLLLAGKDDVKRFLQMRNM